MDQFSLDNTVRTFDQFYDLDFSVNSDSYDAVLAFFRANCSNERIAENFSQNLFRIADATGQDPMTLLKEFEGVEKMNITLTMAYYLNTFGNKTVMFGVSALPAPVFAVARNIVQ